MDLTIIILLLITVGITVGYQYYQKRRQTRKDRLKTILKSQKKESHPTPITDLFTDILERDIGYADIAKRMIPILAYDKTILLQDLAKNVELLLNEYSHDDKKK